MTGIADQRAFVTRAATPADIVAILKLERELDFAAHWQDPAYQEIFAPGSPPRIALVLEDRTRAITGFVVARLIGDECELENIAVAPGLQRQGAGTQLMGALVSAARERKLHSIHLEVRE